MPCVRSLEVLNDLDECICIVDDHQARGLLKRKQAIPIWGKRNILALREVRAYYPVPQARPDEPAAIATEKTWGAETPAYHLTARWPTRFGFPMYPSCFLTRTVFDHLTIAPSSFARKPKARSSYETLLAA